MAGHSKFANIKHRKAAQDKKRGKIFTRIIRDITIACKGGNTNPDQNPALRLALSNARAANLPKDRIEAAIQKGSNSQNKDDYEDILYEGYIKGGIAVIVEVLTDNKNRSASNVRSIFTKYGGALAENVTFSFDRLGYISYAKLVTSNDEFFDLAIEAGASDCESDDNAHHLYCAMEDFNNVRSELLNTLGDAEISSLIWKAHDNVVIEDQESVAKLTKFFTALEEDDDVQEVFTNCILVEK